MTPSALVLVGICFLFLAFALLFLFFGLGWYLTHRKGSFSPYSHKQLVPASELTFFAIEQINKLLSRYDGTINPPFVITTTAVCKETGHLFPNTLNGFQRAQYDSRRIYSHFSRQFVPLQQVDKKWQKKIEPLVSKRKEEIMIDTTYTTILTWKDVPQTNLSLLVCEFIDTLGVN